VATRPGNAGVPLRGQRGLQVRPLGRADKAAVLEHLGRDPVRDAFIASRVHHDAALSSAAWGPLWGALDGRRLAGMLHLGPNLVPAADDPDALDALATVATGPSSARMLVGERASVERLWSRIAHTYPRPREVRACQYVYRLQPGHFLAPPGAVAELATRRDEDEVLRLSAAMHLEEMGEDPLRADPVGYRRRIRTFTSRGWTLVYRYRGRIAFKLDIGCASDTTAQLQGVYTPPDLRHRGLATLGMAACCRLAFRRYPTLSLYVNNYNTRAIALYERLGFARMPYDFQTILLA
jgi:ribosomal protein S18 acetylase RimI-like enzyme